MAWLWSEQSCREALALDAAFASTPDPKFGLEIPLHQALLNKAPEAVLQLLLHAFPEGVHCQVRLGR
jgi:hypothetical protein